MHIVSITVSGFKSYRDATVAGPFCPGHNVIVGRNGSGKSNFFDAVRFLLSDTFSHLRGEERVGLLHEGAGASVLSAYVEVVFDNSDGRFPIDKEAVSLRRMVGLQKDEYALDRKNVSRTEVFNLLESVGFSRSNPYYIVQQGKVAALCAMTDKNRLDLLKEVAGTRVYDERRDESLRIMDETDTKRGKIAEVLSYIESRLSELEAEKEELKRFQELDRERRALEYAVYSKEIEDAKAGLEKISIIRHEQKTSGQNSHVQLDALNETISRVEQELRSRSIELSSVQDERTGMLESRRAQNALIAKLNVDLAEARNAMSAANETVETARQELHGVEQAIESRRRDLQPLQHEYDKSVEAELSLRNEHVETDTVVLSLRVKADRVNQFKTIQDRNVYLAGEIEQVRNTREQSNKSLEKARSDISRLENSLSAHEENISAKQDEVGDTEKHLLGLESELAELRRKRDSVHAERHEKWRKDSEMDRKLNALMGNLKRLEANKRAAFGSVTYHAIETVMEASRSQPGVLGASRVFGPLVDLIDVDAKFTTAADVTAGSALTHVVVDTDATAARLVGVLQGRRAGRVTFIPLNRLGPTGKRVPQATADSLPLVSKIKCDGAFAPAVHQVFGRTLVTRSVEVATQLSREQGVDCVTLEGDQVNKQGALTGGFIDLSKSKIDAAREFRLRQEELKIAQSQASTAHADAAQADGDLSKLLGEIQQKDALYRSALSKTQRLQSQVEQIRRYKRLDEGNLLKARSRSNTLEESIAASEKRLEELEDEISSKNIGGLAPAEESRLQDLEERLEKSGEALSAAVAERAKLETAVNEIRSELDSHLERRKAELKDVVDKHTASKSLREAMGASHESSFVDSFTSKDAAMLTDLENSLQDASTKLSSCESALLDTEKKISDLEQLVADLSNDLGNSKNERARLTKAVEDTRSKVEALFSQKAMLNEKKSDAEQKIRELGSLPSDFEKYKSTSEEALLKKLKQVTSSLKDYSHVNKKALDQYISFTEQRATLQERRDELESGATAIRQLIDSLDRRKDEDIMRTFKGVSKYFAEVFAELVPGGRASLIMLRSNDIEDDGGSIGTTAEARTDKIVYRGVAIKVAFASNGEVYLLQQLSGGQKSIVAMALIFAIQRLDPAPFYLFDEVDANLDATHREAVANLIRRQANNNTQFITTTFRPELVNAAHKWFGVTHRNKVSAVQEVSCDVALTFINKDDNPGR